MGRSLGGGAAALGVALLAQGCAAGGPFQSTKPSRICDPGGGGLFFPCMPRENHWDNGFRAVLYFVGMVWMFLGVSIVSDVFMLAIEKITSQERTLKGSNIKVKVWNPTVANLTLMALGTSSPEILLSVIEIMTSNFFMGDLGAGVIVGSASFNLLVITAICVTALPEGETRMLEQTGVFCVSSAFSLFAYIWVYVILVLSSPNVVEIWEAVVTLMGFPLMVLVAYLTDIGWWSKERTRVTPTIEDEESGGTLAAAVPLSPPGSPNMQNNNYPGSPPLTDSDFLALSTILKNISADKLSKEDTAKLVGELAMNQAQKPSKAQLRMAAMRKISGQRRASVSNLDPALLARYTQQQNHGRPPGEVVAYFCDHNGHANLKYALLESDKMIYLNVARAPTEGPMTLKWATRDGSAHSPLDYEAASGVMDFKDGEASQTICVKVINDETAEPDETFFVDLLEAIYLDKALTQADLGPNTTAEVTIIDDDEPGEIGFEDPPDGEDGSAVIIKKARESCGTLRILVKRTNGACDTISCEYATKNGTAVAGRDYEPTAGRLIFGPREVEKYVEVPIINTSSYEKAHEFQLELTKISGPARALFSAHTACTIRIISDSDTKEIIDDVIKYMETNQPKTERVAVLWRQQFVDAWGLDSADGPVTGPVLFMYVLMLPWKLAFAMIPPTELKGGYPTFVMSLVFIGLCTAMIGDIAALFGCVLGLPDTVTAITFVAMGTSVPDTFASKSAVCNDTTADSAIGNVTGSNAVNVFLGLGLPWTIAAVYWTFFANGEGPAGKVWRNKYGGRDNDGGGGSKGPKKARTIGDDASLAFVVPAGDLGITVATFLCCACVCLSIIYYRRKTYGAELGGAKSHCNLHGAILVSLWFIYIAMSSASSFGAFSTASS